MRTGDKIGALLFPVLYLHNHDFYMCWRSWERRMLILHSWRMEMRTKIVTRRRLTHSPHPQQNSALQRKQVMWLHPWFFSQTAWINKFIANQNVLQYERLEGTGAYGLLLLVLANSEGLGALQAPYQVGVIYYGIVLHNAQNAIIQQ